MDEPSWNIYIIHAKGNPEDVWYVGQTGGMDTRKKQHILSTKNSTHKPMYAHMAEHPWEMTSVELVWSKNEARTAERRWIAHYLAKGAKLFNKQDLPKKSTRDEQLVTKRRIAAEHGINLYENVILIEYPDGLCKIQQWNGTDWVEVLTFSRKSLTSSLTLL